MAKMKPLPSREYLLECFDYNAETGDLIWKTRPREHFTKLSAYNTFHANFAGKKAGCAYKGYMQLKLLEKIYPAHRICWKILTGEDALVDHRNSNGLDNSSSNLRKATTTQNRWNSNRKARTENGFKGVSKRTNVHSTTYVGEVTANGKTHYTKRFKTAAEAGAAREELARKLHGEFYRGYESI